MTTERQKEGNVAEQTFRDLIVRDIEDIESKLNALSRRAVLDDFETGLRYLNDAAYGRNGDKEAERALSEAKERFRMACENSIKVSNNDTLNTFDRITAIRYRMIGAMLETAQEAVGTASDLSSTLKRALPACKQCLQELHSLPAVENSFKVELEKGLLNVRLTVCLEKVNGGR